MAKHKPRHTEFRLGDETLRGLVASGLGPLAVGINALYEAGSVPGEIFDAKKLRACGISGHLTKVIIKQCQGLNFNKHKRKSNKRQKRIRLSADQLSSLENTIEWLVEDLERNRNLLGLIFQGMPTDEVPPKFQELYNEFVSRGPIDFRPPESSAVKALFSKLDDQNELEMQEMQEKRGRGRHGVSSRLPFPDELRQLVHISNHNNRQNWGDSIPGKRTVKDLCDALHLEWFRTKGIDHTKIKVSIAELCNIQGDSPNSIRERNRRNKIKKKHNFFNLPVTSTVVAGLLLRCRGGCWWELELPGPIIIWESNPVEKVAKRYPLSKGGLASARKAWERAHRPNTFEKCLRIGGFDANSYELAPDENLLDDQDQNDDMLYLSLSEVEVMNYSEEIFPF
jgi:hypothetical protein